MILAVIGGGPAGLRAAEAASSLGAKVTLFEAKASVGRKFLVAGRGGLNITKDEAPELFAQHYEAPGCPSEWWNSLIGEFPPDWLRQWASDLEIETFVASTGRVYPREMKAAPLLRRWVHRLKENGVEFAMHHRWAGLRQNDQGGFQLDFNTAAGLRTFESDAVVFALGGGSWPETGSDGKWQPTFGGLGLSVAPLEAANCGWEVSWSQGVLAAEGLPLKNIVAYAGERKAGGELLITKYGLEGGAIYQLGSALRAMPQPAIEIDFKPDVSIERLVKKMGPARRNFLKEAEQRWKLPSSVVTILEHHADRASWTTPAEVASTVKRCRIELIHPRPIAEAISSAGGIRWSEIDDHLMLRQMPGIFVAGEMIDWEAPTGGYLMQGCFATGTKAGAAATAWIRQAAHP